MRFRNFRKKKNSKFYIFLILKKKNSFQFAGIKVTIICPCTDKHIQKYSTQSIRIVRETPELYKTVTVPRLHLESEQFTLNVSFSSYEY